MFAPSKTISLDGESGLKANDSWGPDNSLLLCGSDCFTDSGEFYVFYLCGSDDRLVEAGPWMYGFLKGACHLFRVVVAATVSGWEGPRSWFRSWTQAWSIDKASLCRRSFFKVWDKLFILVRVAGCVCPNAIFLISITCTSSLSASVHRPWSP
jgi:hypothetical protein